MNIKNRLLTLVGSTIASLCFLSLILISSQEANGQTITEATTETFSLTQDAIDVCRQEPGPNLLQNPSFEGQYTSYVPAEPLPDCPAGICTTAQMPSDWTPYWRSQKEFENPDPVRFRQPEYKPACIGTEPCPFPNRLRDGSEALQYFTFFSTHEGGAMQTVSVEQGQTYCFSSWGHSWSAQDDGDAISGPDDGELFQKVGIDPTGGTDFRSSSIIWSDQETDPWGRIQYDEYGLFTISAVAEAGEITVFVYSQPRHPTKHNNVYWDDAYLSLVDPIFTSTITSTADINVLTTVTDTASVSQTIDFDVTGTVQIQTFTWSAIVTDALGVTNTLMFTPTLSPSSGGLTETLEISLDTTGLITGSYAADVLITTDPVTENSPFRIPIRAFVVDELFSLNLPLIQNEP